MMDMPHQRMSDDPDAPPIVEDEKRPQMTDETPPPRRISGKIELMPEEPQVPKRGKTRMDPLPKKGAKKKAGTGRRRGSLPEQIEPRSRGTGTDEPGYLRMRVRVEGGQLSVEDLRHVEGPLVADEPLHGDLAYEVVLGGRRLSSGAIPDAGTMRSFPHPDPAPGQEGHAFTPATSYEFVVRVPKEAVSARSLPRLDVRVYRVKEPVPRTRSQDPLGERFPRELDEIGQIRGIRVEDLPKSAQAEARRALR
jgi:hypothetical protein